MRDTVELGLGLIGIGRPWGHAGGEVPGEREARSLLETAAGLGIRYFDTAPSYGGSEGRLGDFLRGADRSGLTIATKFGEHWDAERAAPYVDHSYDALRRSLDRSLALLGRIDILQLHKTTPEALRSRDLERAWEYARSAGIPVAGASVSDLESAALVEADPRYGCVQLPFNHANPRFAAALDTAAARGLWVAVNRPYAMGAMLYGEAPVAKREAFAFILARRFRGVVLTGTKCPAHLAENWRAFQEAAGQAAAQIW